MTYEEKETQKAELREKINQATQQAIQSIQTLVGTGNLDAIIGTQEEIARVEDDEKRVMLMNEYDKALLGVAKTYDDLTPYIEKFKNAQTEEEKAQARLTLGLKVGAKQAEKEFKNLNSVPYPCDTGRCFCQNPAGIPLLFPRAYGRIIRERIWTAGGSCL